MKKRYSDAERKALLREWRRSGKSVGEFCDGRTLHSSTLRLWSRRGETKVTNGPGGDVHFVEAVPVDSSQPPSQPVTDFAGGCWAWELCGPVVALRGARLDEPALRMLLAAVVGGQS